MDYEWDLRKLIIDFDQTWKTDDNDPTLKYESNFNKIFQECRDSNNLALWQPNHNTHSQLTTVFNILPTTGIVIHVPYFLYMHFSFSGHVVNTF